MVMVTAIQCLVLLGSDMLRTEIQQNMCAFPKGCTEKSTSLSLLVYPGSMQRLYSMPIEQQVEHFPLQSKLVPE